MVSCVNHDDKLQSHSLSSVIDKMWEVTFALSFFYIFFFQNVIFDIGGLIIVLTGVLTIFSLLNWVKTNKGMLSVTPMLWLGVFVTVSLCGSYVFSNNFQDSLDVGLRMMEYLLLAYSLFCFVKSHPYRFYAIIRYIWLSISLLCIGVLIKGTAVTSAGGLGLGTLNVNLLSSYILIQVFCSFVLLGNAKKKMNIMLICTSVVVSLFVQIMAASRRGFLVASAYLLLAIFFVMIPKYTKRHSKKRILIYMVLLIALLITIALLGDYIINETVLGSRFLGNFNSGDIARTRYRNIAIQEFCRRPILGVGLNGLTSVMGAYSHSLYYETLACTGVVGALILFLMLANVSADLFKQVKRKEYGASSNTYVSRLCFLYLVLLFVSGIAVTMIYDFYFFMSVGLVSAVCSICRD